MQPENINFPTETIVDGTVTEVMLVHPNSASSGIEGAAKFGRSWAIPINVERPSDGRETTGLYKNWRKKN